MSAGPMALYVTGEVQPELRVASATVIAFPRSRERDSTIESLVTPIETDIADARVESIST